MAAAARSPRRRRANTRRALRRRRVRLQPSPSFEGSPRFMVCVVPEVETTRDGAVLSITLNRPDVLNALNEVMHAGLHAALRQARDPAVRAVVLTGAGRGFCVGQDLQELRSGSRDVAHTLRDRFNSHVLAIRALE